MNVEKRDRRKHAAVVVLGLRQAEFHHDAVHVPLDGPFGDPKPPTDARIRASLGHQRENIPLATRELLEWVADVACCDELLNECGIDDRATAAGSPDSFEEVVELGDTTLSR